VGKIGVEVTAEGLKPLQPLNNNNKSKKRRMTLLGSTLITICVDYKRFQTSQEGNLIFLKIAL
jgi:hypothetical protein